MQEKYNQNIGSPDNTLEHPHEERWSQRDEQIKKEIENLLERLKSGQGDKKELIKELKDMVENIPS